MQLTGHVINGLREQFPALKKHVNGKPAAYFDGPAGTQVPQVVIDAISHYLSNCNANHNGLFATSRESDRMLHTAHQAASDFLGANDSSCVSFGANMTTLTMALSRALSKTWSEGDEIVVTRMEHDANFTPWILAAKDAGVAVQYVDIDPTDCTLDLDDFLSKINERTRLVAVGCASNATGTVNPVRQICEWTRDAGAISFLDAVHFAPHELIDVDDFGCDFLVCSAYKFFGPHVGIMWGRAELLEELKAYKLRPAPDDLPGKWMTGTQNHECIAGTLAAVDYIASIGRRQNPQLDRRSALAAAFEEIRKYERELLDQLLDGLAEIPGVRVWGITDPENRDNRLPTVAMTHESIPPHALARMLADEAIFVWHGNYYALPLTERLGLEPSGMVRIGLVHYNTAEEVERLLAVLRQA